MKLYDNKMANSPRKVRMFLVEKNITDIELIEIDIMKGELNIIFTFSLWKVTNLQCNVHRGVGRLDRFFSDL